MKIKYWLTGGILGALLFGSGAVVITALSTGTISAILIFLFGGWIVSGAGMIMGVIIGNYAFKRVAGCLGPDGKVKTKNNRLVRYLIGGPLLLTIVFSLTTAYFSYPPPDWILLLNFKMHRSAFDRLALMENEDKYAADVSPPPVGKGSSNTSGAPASRIASYRRLLQTIGADHIFGDDQHDFNLNVYQRGSSFTSGQDKGYTYLTVVPDDIVGNLDTCLDSGPYYLTYHRHIEGNWYLDYEFTPE